MSLSIELRKIDHIILMELSGRVSVLEPGVKDIAQRLIAQGEKYFIVNLANVVYLDNAGLGQLCWIFTLSRNRGGDMKLLKPTPRIRALLAITKLDTIFQCFDTELEAVNSMRLISTISA